MIYCKNKYVLFVLVFALMLLVDFSLNGLASYYYPAVFDNIKQIRENASQYALFDRFIKLILVAPFLETLIFQFGIIEFIKKMKGKDSLAILISALAFSLAHAYSIVYILMMIPSALILAVYYSYLRKGSRTLAYLSVSLLHLCYNTIAFFNNYS